MAGDSENDETFWRRHGRRWLDLEEEPASDEEFWRRYGKRWLEMTADSENDEEFKRRWGRRWLSFNDDLNDDDSEFWWRPRYVALDDQPEKNDEDNGGP